MVYAGTLCYACVFPTVCAYRQRELPWKSLLGDVLGAWLLNNELPSAVTDCGAAFDSIETLRLVEAANCKGLLRPSCAAPAVEGV